VAQMQSEDFAIPLHLPISSSASQGRHQQFPKLEGMDQIELKSESSFTQDISVD